MRIGCLQFAPRVAEVDANMDLAEEILRRADPRDLDLLVLPELAFSGYNFKTLHQISPFLEFTDAGITSAWARATALKYDCTVVVGYPEKIDPTLNWPSNPEYYNSAIIIDGDGETVGNYRKSHLYYTDETWALEGAQGFFSRSIPGLGRTALGICMDLNPYKFEAPWEAYEFAYHTINSDARLVVLSMAWNTHTDASTFFQKPYDPDMETVAYWISRLEPLISLESTQEVIVVFVNRTGVESDATYVGTSAVVGIQSGEVRLYGVLGRGEQDLLVIDTQKTPFATLQFDNKHTMSASTRDETEFPEDFYLQPVVQNTIAQLEQHQGWKPSFDDSNHDTNSPALQDYRRATLRQPEEVSRDQSSRNMKESLLKSRPHYANANPIYLDKEQISIEPRLREENAPQQSFKTGKEEDEEEEEEEEDDDDETECEEEEGKPHSQALVSDMSSVITWLDRQVDDLTIEFKSKSSIGKLTQRQKTTATQTRTEPPSKKLRNTDSNRSSTSYSSDQEPENSKTATSRILLKSVAYSQHDAVSTSGSHTAEQSRGAIKTKQDKLSHQNLTAGSTNAEQFLPDITSGSAAMIRNRMRRNSEDNNSSKTQIPMWLNELPSGQSNQEDAISTVPYDQYQHQDQTDAERVELPILLPSSRYRIEGNDEKQNRSHSRDKVPTQPTVPHHNVAPKAGRYGESLSRRRQRHVRHETLLDGEETSQDMRGGKENIRQRANNLQNSKLSRGETLTKSRLQDHTRSASASLEKASASHVANHYFNSESLYSQQKTSQGDSNRQARARSSSRNARKKDVPVPLNTSFHREEHLHYRHGFEATHSSRRLDFYKGPKTPLPMKLIPNQEPQEFEGSMGIIPMKFMEMERPPRSQSALR